ncbi:MAG: hypothetical protein PEPC_01690 [Peptostreptococcus russellii]
MKGKILTIMFVLFLSFFPDQKANAQFAVVDGPHTFLNSTEWFANVKKWANQVNEMVDAQKLREGLQNIDQLKQLKSLMELADLLDDVACLSAEYNFYVNMGANYQCLKFLNFKRVSVNMQMSSDLLFKIVTVSSFFSMNSEGRMSFVEQAKSALEKAVKDMEEFNNSVRNSIISKSMKNYTKNAYYSGTLSAYNRYQY